MSQRHSRELTAPGAKTQSPRTFRELLAPGYWTLSFRQPVHIVLCAALIAALLIILWWFDPAKMNLPLCSFHNLTGLDCPGCGVIRATHELLHGRLAAALHYNALWVISLPLVGYAAISEWRVLAGHRPLPGDLPRRTWFWLSVAAVAIVFFVARNV